MLASPGNCERIRTCIFQHASPDLVVQDVTPGFSEPTIFLCPTRDLRRRSCGTRKSCQHSLESVDLSFDLPDVMHQRSRYNSPCRLWPEQLHYMTGDATCMALIGHTHPSPEQPLAFDQLRVHPLRILYSKRALAE